jgi:hypothetical protein
LGRLWKKDFKMGFDFRFRFLEDEKELRQLKNFLIEQPFSYPNYEDWVERTIPEIDHGYKRTILAFSDDIIVGDLIFQPHKTLPRIMEFKNMRIHQDLKRRYFGFFMLRQAESESENYDAIICDTRSDRLDVLNLMKLCGYREISRIPLYDSNVEDAVLLKNLKNLS